MSLSWKPSLRLTITLIIALLILVSGLLVIGVSSVTARRSILTFSDQLVTRIESGTRDEVAGYLKPAKPALRLSLALLAPQPMAPKNLETTEGLLFEVLRANSFVNRFFYGDDAGRFLMLQKEPDGSVSTKIIRSDGDKTQTFWRKRLAGAPFDAFEERSDPHDTFDPRKRPWYASASKARKGAVAWTDVYVLPTGHEPGITAALAHRPDGDVIRGVVGVDIALTDLSHYLAGLGIKGSGRAFVMDGGRRLVAVPDPDDLVAVEAKGPDGAPGLRLIGQSSLPEIACIGRSSELAEMLASPLQDEGVRGSIECLGVGYVVAFSPVRFGQREPWTVGVVLPEAELTADIRRANIAGLVIIACILAFALAVGLLIARVLARSLRLLVSEAESVRCLDLTEPTSFDTSFREVYEVLQAFDRMKVGLRAFNLYAPGNLVRILLQHGVEPKLGGAMKETTVLFTDIRNFTAISEYLDVQDLATKLGAYLTAVTQCITRRHGTVDKYIGDSVMAFWNAPLDVRDHAVEACWAAMGVLIATKELETRDPSFPRFYTRIGIHTGNVMVGNFGSQERLNYTCMGDGVNLASRLEGLNTLYGVQIIISEDTQIRVEATFETRKVDRVTVRGKKTPTAIYELIGPKDRVEEGRLRGARIYEQALDFYFRRQWDQALRGFTAAGEANPHDPCVEVMKARCEKFRLKPPPEDWNGVTVIARKT